MKIRSPFPRKPRREQQLACDCDVCHYAANCTRTLGGCLAHFSDDPSRAPLAAKTPTPTQRLAVPTHPLATE